MGNPTFYDGRLSLVYWSPASVGESTIAQLADNIRTGAPNVTGLLVKTNNGAGWQGAFDSSKPNLAISSTADVQRWVDTLGSRGLECHVWGVVRGVTVQSEINRFVEICQVAGVKSLLLDLEQGPAYFVGDRTAAQQLAAGLRQRLGPDFHIGLIFDYRGQRPTQLWVQSVWFPEIDSLHPMVYHYHFGVSAQTALTNCYNAIGRWGKAVYPMLQGYSPGGTIGLYPASDIPVTAALAINSFSARGLSWYRYGEGLNLPDEGLGPGDLPEVAKVTLPVGAPPPPAPTPPPVIVGRPPLPPDAPPLTTIVDPDNERTGEFSLNYYDDPAALAPGWSAALDANGRPFAYRAATFNAQRLYVAYAPRLIGRGKYVIEAYIPDQHATTPDAHYFVVDYPNGQRRETTVIVNQAQYHNQWVPLQSNIVNGVPGAVTVTQFDLDPTRGDAGRVNMADITFQDPAGRPGGQSEIAFGALRWRPVGAAGAVAPAAAVSLDAPVGTEAERQGALADGRRTAGGYTLWAGEWFDANPLGSRYWLGNRWAIHTGADLNLTGGVIADKDAPVYSIGYGIVVWARWVSAGWKNIVVIEHPVPGEDRVVWA
ncbi:MAG: hypothetical protein KA764_17615, partial [Anaerolineales bacterium]|nr:hypothetical protein [Anaerolineales bacterium]